MHGAFYCVFNPFNASSLLPPPPPISCQTFISKKSRNFDNLMAAIDKKAKKFLESTESIVFRLTHFGESLIELSMKNYRF